MNHSGDWSEHYVGRHETVWVIVLNNFRLAPTTYSRRQNCGSISIVWMFYWLLYIDILRKDTIPSYLLFHSYKSGYSRKTSRIWRRVWMRSAMWISQHDECQNELNLNKKLINKKYELIKLMKIRIKYNFSNRS